MNRRGIVQVPFALCAIGCPMRVPAQARAADSAYRIALVPELAGPGLHEEFIRTLCADEVVR